jgi:hypothetical protein
MRKKIVKKANNYKTILANDGAIVVSKFFGYKKLYRFETLNNTFLPYNKKHTKHNNEKSKV